MSDIELINHASIVYNKQRNAFTNNITNSELQDLESGLYGSTKSGQCRICGQTKNCHGHYGVCQLPYPIIANTIILEKFVKLIQSLCPVCSSFPIKQYLLDKALELPAKERFNYVYDTVKTIRENNNIMTCPHCKFEIMMIKCNGVYPSIIYEVQLEDSNKTYQVNPIMIHEILSRFTDQSCEYVGFNAETFHPRNFMTYYLTIIPNQLRLKSFETASSTITSTYKTIIDKILPDLQAIHRTNVGTKCYLPPTYERDQFNKLYSQLNAWYGLYMDMTKDANVNACSAVVGKRDKKHIDEGASMIGRFSGKYTSYFNKGIIATRHNNSVRTVLGGSPELACTNVGLPKKICNKLGFFVPVYKENIDYVNKLVEGKISGPYCIKLYKTSFGEVIKLRSDKEYLIEPGDKIYVGMLPTTLVLYSRFPTIREESCSSFEIVQTNHPVMTIPLTTAPMKTADFDGDETQIYAPSSWYTDAELLLLQSAPRVARQYKDGNLVIYFTADTNFELAAINKNTMIGFETVYDEYGTRIGRKEIKPRKALDMISEFFEECNMDVCYTDKTLEIIHNKISDDKCKLNNQAFFTYLSTIYSMRRTLKLMNMIIQLGYNLAKFKPITMGNEVRFYNKEVQDEIIKIKQQTYDKMKLIEQSNKTFREKTIAETLAFESQKVPIIKHMLDSGKDTNLDNIGFLNKFQNEYYTNMVNMDFAIIDGDRIKPNLADHTRVCTSYPKFSIDPAAYGYINHGYASPNIKPSETFYDCMVQRKSMYDKGSSIGKQGYLSKRFTMAYGNTIIDCNGCSTYNNMLLSFNYGVEARLKHNLTLIGINKSFEELCKDLKIESTQDDRLKELHHNLTHGRSVYNRLTSHTKNAIMNDQFCCGFNYDQWLIWNSEQNKPTPDEIINELCEKINEICCPPKMKQRYGLLNNEPFEYYLRTKLRTCKINRQQAVQMYYFYIHSLAPSGDNVGMKASLAISEAFTQAGLNSIHKASGGGVNVERLKRSTGLDRFNELLGGSTHKNTVYTFGFIENTREAAEKFAREQETVYFCELWNKLEIIITDKLPELIYKLHPNIPKEKFDKLAISPKYLRITLDLAKIANYDIKLSHLIEKIYTDVTCLITGHITNKHELTLYVLFDQRLTQKQLDSIINKWKMKTKNNIICGNYLCNCFVTQNVNDGSWLVLANETDVNNKTLENLIYHPAIDVAKCKTSNVNTTQAIFGVCESESRLFEELYYAATNLSDTKNILERHYKTICDTAFADGKLLTAVNHSIKKHKGDYLNRINFETPGEFIRLALEDGEYTKTDDPIAAATFNDIPKLGTGFSKVMVIEK
jgi:DNA-directed RNA polymerase beta' subunit